MKRAKTQIIQTSRANLKYYLSILEKQNDSGILFNDRLFFLLSGQHIGYISEIKLSEDPEHINFEKPKTTVLLTNIKSIVVNLAQLSIKFNLIDGNKKSERTWILRTEKEELARQWYDLLQRQKIGSTSSKILSPKKSQLPEGWRLSQKKTESPEKKKELTISRHLELAEIARQPEKEKGKQKEKQKEFKEIGIGMSPKNAEQKKIEFKDLEEKLKSIMKESRIEQRQSPKPIERPVQRQSPKHSQRSIQKSAERSYQKPPAPQKPLEKPSELTLQNTSRREISELQKSSQRNPASDTKPMLVNTKYLNQRHEKQRSRDYLDRTHELVKSFEPERSIKNTSFIALKEIQEQPLKTPKNEGNITSIEKSEDWHEIPWTYKYIRYGHLIFKEFQVHTQSLMRELVFDQSHRKDMVKFKPKLIKNGIHYYDIKDIEVKLAFIGLEDLDSSPQNLEAEKVCNKRPVKTIQNEFNNFKALYEYLGNEQKLRVPLLSICSHNGFVALFKVTSKNLKKLIRFKQIQYELSQLEKRSKIHGNFIESLSNIIIQLDEAYYQQFRQEKEEGVSFNLFFIQEIQEFLLPDLVTDNPNDRVLLLRKELIDNYRIDSAPIKKDISYFKESSNKTGYSKELETFSKSILVAVSDAIVEMDSFRAYFLNSKEFSDFLHSKGVNLRYLGHLYSNLKAVFQRRFVMTEMAARSCKALFRKTLQDLALMEDAPQGMQMHCKICDFLNCVLGGTFETAAIWKVLSTHAKAYFGLELNFDQIDRGHFIVALVDNLKLEVVWEKVWPEEAFKSNIFFSEKNLIGLGVHSKSYTPIFTGLYNDTVRILEREETHSGFEALLGEFDLKNKPIPAEVAAIEPEIRRYLSSFISPARSEEYPQLGLYANCEGGRPSKLSFQLLLMRIKWALRQGEREEYIRVCDCFIRAATKCFGEFHPVFSELYELFSAYHLSSSEYEDAITFAKSSLVNILRVCGSTHERTAECYFHLALCYIRSGRREEGAAHIRKSLAILEANARTETAPYAVMQVKLGLLLLSQGQPEECVQRVLGAQAIFEARAAESPGGFEDEATECLELLGRCYELLQWRAEARELLAECEGRLRRTARPRNLDKLLKIYLHPLLAALSPEQASLYLDMLSALSVPPDEASCEAAFGLLRVRIAEESLLPCLRTYLGKLESIEQHVREKGMLRGWVNFAEVYERETVKDFLALTVELLTFLGEGFLSGALRDAL